MKKIIVTLALATFSLGYAGDNSDNPFVYEETTTQDNQVENSPGNPGDPVPIDDYIPVLVMVGLGLVVYYGNKLRKLS